MLYRPRNYDDRFRGPLLARRALAGSENVPAVALASRHRRAKLLRFLRSAGLPTFDRNAAYYGLGITLGDAEVRLDELVAAYSAFARGGVSHRTDDPAPNASARGGVDSLVSPRTAFWITDILGDDERGRTRSGEAAASNFRSRSQRRRARRRRTTTTGRSGTRAGSRSACGSGISIAGRSSDRPA